MGTKLPTPIPQVPVRDLARAIEFYQSRLGFSLDWKHEDGIAGVSRENARLFLDRVTEEPLHPICIWLNLHSIFEVDTLHGEWQKTGVTITSTPEQKPWGLYEFIAEDCDGNSYRVFYDTATPTPVSAAAQTTPTQKEVAEGYLPYHHLVIDGFYIP